MTLDEFISGYCSRSGITWEWLSQYKVALPCACGEENCEGWAMVSKDMVDIHNELYGPNQARPRTGREG